MLSGIQEIKISVPVFQGVVVIDDILHHKSRLQLATASKSEKIESLNELGKKIPPRHVMMSTKIGRLKCMKASST